MSISKTRLTCSSQLMILSTAFLMAGSSLAVAGLQNVSDSTLSGAFAEWKLGANGLPSVRSAVDLWEPARAAAREQKDWTTWLDERKRGLDQWMLTARERPDQPVGWAHDYVDLQTGAFLKWSPDSVAPPAGSSAKVQAAWLMFVRSHNIEQMLEAARFYRLLDDVRYRDWAIAQLDAYSESYVNLPLQTKNGQSRLFNQALDEAVYCFQLLEVVRLVRKDVDQATLLERWQTRLFAPMAENLISSSKADHNIAVWISAAVAAIGSEFDLPRVREFNANSERSLLAILERGTSEDYFWHEMSLHYQNYVALAVSNWVYAASIRGDDSARWRRVGLITRNLMISPLSLRFANMEGPMLNDNLGQMQIPARSLWGRVARVIPTKIGIAQAASTKSWDTLLDPLADLSATTALPPVKSQNFPGLDMVQLVADDWQAQLRYGQRVATHAHQESLSYDLQFDGVWLFRDPGTVGYGSPLHAKYFRRAQSHSVPLIGREGQLPWPAEGALISADTTSAMVRHKNYQRGHDVERELVAKGRKFSDTVKFTLGDGKRLPVGLTFNTVCQVTPGKGLTQVDKDDLGKLGGFAYWTERRQYSAAPSVQFDLLCKDKKFLMTLSGDQITTAFIAATPTTEKAAGQRTGIFVETSPISETAIAVAIVAVSP